MKLLALVPLALVAILPAQPSSSVRIHRRFDAINELIKFGYMIPHGSHFDVESAIRDFQRFNGLRATGRLTSRTIKKMLEPRCDVPDLNKPHLDPLQHRKTGKRETFDIYNPGNKWPSRTISYKLVVPTKRMTDVKQKRAISRAFEKWSEVTGLKFKETKRKADIEIKFVKTDHGDRSEKSFDVREGPARQSRAIAHAFFPGSAPEAGDIHFNDNEEWTIRGKKAINLEIVATHQIGHSLGLGHSNNPEAVMAPYYKYKKNFKLHKEDTDKIRKLYPAQVASLGMCGLRFDDMEQIHDGRIIAFRKRHAYFVGREGLVNKTRTRDLFPIAPSNPGAVVYDRFKRHIFFFKGKRYWRYTDFKLDPGYPKELPKDFQKVRAAMQWRDGAIYLFKKGQYMKWEENYRKAPAGYPRKSRSLWVNFPGNPDAAFWSYDGYYYVFKAKKYWRYNYRAGLSLGYPRSMAQTWLNCGRPRHPQRSPQKLNDPESKNDPQPNTYPESDVFSFLTKTIREAKE